jgi:hypothetical protein
MRYDVAEGFNDLGRFIRSLVVFATIASAIGSPFAALWLFSDLLPFQEGITVYEMSCSEPRKKGICEAKEATLGRTTFQAFPEQQFVVYWRESGEILLRRNDCVVRDSKNWSCGEAGTFMQKVMANGKFSYGLLVDSTSALYAVPKWRWWWVKLHEGDSK